MRRGIARVPAPISSLRTRQSGDEVVEDDHGRATNAHESANVEALAAIRAS